MTNNRRKHLKEITLSLSTTGGSITARAGLITLLACFICVESASAHLQPPVEAEPKNQPKKIINPPKSPSERLAEQLTSAPTEEEKKAAAVALMDQIPGTGLAVIQDVYTSPEKIQARSACLAAMRRRPVLPTELLGVLLDFVVQSNSATTNEYLPILQRFPPAIVRTDLKRRLSTTELDIESQKRSLKLLRLIDPSLASVSFIAEQLDASSKTLAETAIQQLSTIAGINFKNADEARAWWQSKRNLPEHAWLIEVANRRQAKYLELNNRHAVLTSKHIDSQRDCYLAATDEDRPDRLVALLSDPMLEMRKLGLDLIDAMVIDQKQVPEIARDAIVTRLSDKDSSIRSRAAILIGNLRIEGALTVLLDALNGETNNRCRNSIINALGRLDNIAAIDPLVEYVAHHADGSFTSAVSALGYLARKGNVDADTAHRVTETLISRYRNLSDGQASKRVALLEAMGRIANPESGPILIDATDQNMNEAVRVQAIASLVNVKSEPVLVRLRDLLQDPNIAVRNAAISSLGRLATDEADFARLARRADETVEPNSQTRDAAWAAAKNVFERLPANDQYSVVSVYSTSDASTTRMRRITLLRLLKTLRASMQTFDDHTKGSINLMLANLLLEENESANALTAFLETANFGNALEHEQLLRIDGHIVDLALQLNDHESALNYLLKTQGEDRTTLAPRVDAMIKQLVPGLIKMVDQIESKETFFQVQKSITILSSLESGMNDDMAQLLADLKNRSHQRRQTLIDGTLRTMTDIESLKTALTGFDNRHIIIVLHQRLSALNANTTTPPDPDLQGDELVLIAFAKQLKPGWPGYDSEADSDSKQAAIDALVVQ